MLELIFDSLGQVITYVGPFQSFTIMFAGLALLSMAPTGRAPQ